MISFSAAVLIVLPDVPWAGSASPRAAQTAVDGEKPMSYDDQRARWASLRANQEIIDSAASRLRNEAAQDKYRGPRDPQVAFGLTSILDELSRHSQDLDEALRRRVVELYREPLRAN
jgi:hypothetical protein